MNDIISIARQTLELSQICDELATRLRDRARQLWRAGEIDEDAYDDATAMYNRIRGKSREFGARASSLAATGMGRELQQLAQATQSLKQARGKLDRAANLVAVATKMLAMTTAIAAMALTPSPGTVVASVMAIKEVVNVLASS